jgi:hypothetical protein
MNLTISQERKLMEWALFLKGDLIYVCISASMENVVYISVLLADKRRSLGRYSSLADSGHWV